MQDFLTFPRKVTPLAEGLSGRQGIQELCRKHGLSDATFYQWRAKYAGLAGGDVNKLRQLEEEDRRLKQRVAEQSLTSRP